MSQKNSKKKTSMNFPSQALPRIIEQLSSHIHRTSCNEMQSRIGLLEEFLPQWSHLELINHQTKKMQKPGLCPHSLVPFFGVVIPCNSYNFPKFQEISRFMPGKSAHRLHRAWPSFPSLRTCTETKPQTAADSFHNSI